MSRDGVTTMSRTRFASFEFDPRTGELWRGGRRVRLQRQPSRLLELLVARSGELVTREEIREALWGGDTYVDFDRSLNFCVGKLRSALRDNAAAPAYVETVPTRGYRFIAPVEEVQPAAADVRVLETTPPPVAADAARRASLRALLIAGAVVAAVIALLLLLTLPAAAPPKVLVVPFHNETGVPDLDLVAKGVSDATVVKLAASDRLRVIGNASGLTFSFRPTDMKAMGDSLGAQYLVLGQMKRDERRMRIVAHLIRVSDQTHVWATTFDRPVLDLATQSAIADEIAKAVTARVFGDKHL
jgi:TolB-like protein/DNA-binding winged helix-turn-helix (wHTH) protein